MATQHQVTRLIPAVIAIIGAFTTALLVPHGWPLSAALLALAAGALTLLTTWRFDNPEPGIATAVFIAALAGAPMAAPVVGILVAVYMMVRQP